jgi:hypothetical protein
LIFAEITPFSWRQSLKSLNKQKPPPVKDKDDDYSDDFESENEQDGNKENDAGKIKVNSVKKSPVKKYSFKPKPAPGETF